MLGANINFYRKKCGLTQIEMADKLNVHKGTISLWETGRRTPDIQTLMKIAEIFRVGLDQLCNNKSGINVNNEFTFIPESRKNLIREVISLSDEEARDIEFYIKGYKANKAGKINFYSEGDEA